MIIMDFDGDKIALDRRRNYSVSRKSGHIVLIADGRARYVIDNGNFEIIEKELKIYSSLKYTSQSIFIPM